MQLPEIVALVAAVAWFPLCLLVANTARSYQRSAKGWFALAFVFSPVVAYIFLLVADVPQKAVIVQEKVERISNREPEHTDVLDTANYEKSCPKCGAVVNAATGDGLHWAEKEPWRLFCKECDTEIKI